MATQPSVHESYLQHSPYYAAACERFGRTMHVMDAALIASDHGNTMEELKEAGLTINDDGSFSTLALFQALGY